MHPLHAIHQGELQIPITKKKKKEEETTHENYIALFHEEIWLILYGYLQQTWKRESIWIRSSQGISSDRAGWKLLLTPDEKEKLEACIFL